MSDLVSVSMTAVVVKKKKKKALSKFWILKLSFQPEELACLSIDLRLEAFVIKDSLSLQWRYEDGLVNNIESIVEEYKDTRQLLVKLYSRQRCFTNNLLDGINVSHNTRIPLYSWHLCISFCFLCHFQMSHVKMVPECYFPAFANECK